jgi:osmotically-inducible protein OsmY
VAAREIYNDPLLQGYAYDISKPIHIIVDNGRVTLMGWVGSEAEKAWAASLVEFHTDAVDVVNDLVVKSKKS